MRNIWSGVVLALLVCGCNGGGSDSGGVVFEGTLTERGEGHAAEALLVAKHSAGQRIEGVKVCVVGECSVTDGMGQWGVHLSEFPGGDVSVSADGHGISASVVANVPATAGTVTLDLDHSGNSLTIAKMLIDGQDHTGHTSEHDHSAME